MLGPLRQGPERHDDEDDDVPVLLHDDVEEAYDVRVLQLLEERDLADGGGRDALLVRLQPDLFHRHDFARHLVQPLEDHPVGPLPDLLQFAEILQLEPVASG